MSQLKRRMVMALIILIVVTSGATIGYYLTRNNSGSSLQVVNFRLKWLFLANYAESFAALDRGYWAERGLEVNIHPGGFENDSIKLVAAGSDHFGITGGDDLLIARGKQIPIVAIAGIYQDTPVAFIVRADSGIEGPRDFAGRTVGRKYGTNVDTQYKIMMTRAGVAEGSVKYVPVKFDLLPILTGTVDVYPGYAMGQPEDLRNQGLEIKVIRASDHGIQSYGNVLFTTEAMITENPSLVQRFVSGYLDGLRYAIANPENAVDDTIRHNDKLDRGVQVRVIHATMPFWQPSNSVLAGSMSHERWEETQSVLLDGGILDAGVDLSRAYESRFVEAYYGTK